MKLYKTKAGIVIENENKFHSANEDWDSFVNDDSLFQKMKQFVSSLPEKGNELITEVLAPIGKQELWACGVTYLKRKVGRQEESKAAGGGDFYARVYEAERPEIF